MFNVFIQIKIEIISKFINIAVYPDSCVTVIFYVFERFYILTFSSSYDWREYLKLSAFRQFQNPVDYLIHRLPGYAFPASIAVRCPNLSIEDTEIIVYLSYCSCRRSWIFGNTFLIYGNRR